MTSRWHDPPTDAGRPRPALRPRQGRPAREEVRHLAGSHVGGLRGARARRRPRPRGARPAAAGDPRARPRPTPRPALPRDGPPSAPGDPRPPPPRPPAPPRPPPRP